MSAKAEEVIAKYVELRDRKSAMEKAHKEEVAKLDKAMDTIEVYLLALLKETGADSFKTANGTAYKTTRVKASIADRGLARDFVLKTGNLDLLELRASSTGVKAYVEEHGALPTGFSSLTEETVNIRRSN